MELCVNTKNVICHRISICKNELWIAASTSIDADTHCYKVDIHGFAGFYY